MPREVVLNRNDCYIYRHIRLDKNEPFYIGIGTGRNYKRARKKGNQRSEFWNRIANKTPYEIEIILDNLTWQEACIKETEFIKLYGRRDLGTGTLVNMTNGGDGVYGHKKSEETIKKMSISIKKAMKGKSPSKEQMEATANTFRNIHKDPILNQKRIEGIRKASGKIAEKLSKNVIQMTIDGEFIKLWQSSHQIYRELKYHRACIKNCCNGIHKQAYGYKWKYA